MTDVLLINGMEFLNSCNLSPYIGHYILENLLNRNNISARQISIDAERKSGRLILPDEPDGIFDAVADYIVSMNPRIVGFNTICNSFITAVQISMKIHAKAPEILIFFGGPHATLTAEACLRSLDFLTLVCLGESEYSIVPVVRAMLDNTSLDSVPGISYRKDGRIVSTPCCDLVPAEHLADYTVFDYGEDFRSLSLPYTIEGGRGCPFHCSFCSTSMFWKQAFRVKPVGVLIDEMDRCHAELGTTVFAVEHDMFTANRKHITDFCTRLIERGTPYYWKCSSRVDVLDEELIELLCRAGCVSIFLGIETGSERMQKTINKNLNLTNAVQMAKCLKKHGIKVTASFIYGFPDETEEDFIQTVHLMEELLLSGIENLQFHPFMLLPGTEETEKVKERAIFNERDVDFSIYNRRVINDESRDLIQKYKDIFIQYYSFESEVKKKYPWFEMIFAMSSFQWYFFKNTFVSLTKQPGLITLYRKYEQIFKDFYYQFNDIDYADSIMQITRDCLAHVVSHENNEELSEIFRFENDIFEYADKGIQDSQIKEYRLSIDKTNGECSYLPDSRKYMIKREGAAKIGVVPIPGWMSVEP